MRVFRVLFLFLFIALVLSMAACDEDTYWVKNYYQDEKSYLGTATIKTSDDGYLHLVNNFHLFSSTPEKAYVLKLNQDGSIQWQKNYSAGTDNEQFHWAIESGSSYILAGNNNNFDSTAWIMKINSNGTAISWEKSYKINGFAFIPNGFVESFSGGYTLGGENCIFEVDSDGNHVRNKFWNTSYFVSKAIARTGDGYILVSEDLAVMKLDTTGNLVWAKQYSNSNGTLALDASSLKKISSTSDNGCVIVATFSDTSTGKTDLTVLKINSNGSMGWQKRISKSFNSTGASIDVAANGEIIIGGQYATIANPQDDDDYYAWVLELNSSGTPQWQLGTNDPIYSIMSVEANSTGYCITGFNIHTVTTPTGTAGYGRSALLILDGDGKTSGSFTYENALSTTSSVTAAVNDISVSPGNGSNSVTDTSSIVDNAVFSLFNY